MNRWKRPRTSPLRSFVQLVMAASLLLALMMPSLGVWSAPTAASSLTDAAVNGDASAEPSEFEVLPEESLAPEESLIPDESASPEEQTGTGSITVATWDCPDTVDPATVNGGDLADACVDPLDGVTISIAIQDQNLGSQDTSGGSTTFTDLPANTYFLGLVLPPGYVAAWAPECSPSGQPSTDFGIELADGDALTCDWYLFPEPQVDPTAIPSGPGIVIAKYTCPDDYDAEADDADPIQDCTESTDGVQFNATGPNGYAAQTDTGDSIPGAVSFGGLEPGDYTVTETPPDGIGSAAVGCVAYDFSPGADNTPQNLAPISDEDAFSTVFTVAAGSDELTYCSWYDFPAQNTITIEKWLCPAGYDYEDPDASYEDDCAVPLDDVEFTLSRTSPDPSDSTAVTGEKPDDGDRGIATFTGFGPGEYDLTETDTDGESYAADAFRVCDDFGFGQPGAEPTTLGEPFSFTVEEDQIFDGHCDWYNIPDDGSSPSPGESPSDGGQVIVINKYLCPAGYDYTDPAAQPYADCQEPVDGVEFQLSRTDPDPIDLTETTGDDGDAGVVTFEGIVGGSWQLSESDSPYTDGFVLCFGIPGFDETTVRGIALGETIDFEVPSDAPFSASCAWFNIPTTNTITITKWLCPANYDYTDDESQPDEDCLQTVDGVEFTLSESGGGSPVTATTGDTSPGVATFTDFGPGEYDLTETDTGGESYAEDGFRICDDFGFGQPGPEATVLGEPFTFTVEDGELFEGTCDWYNIPSTDTSASPSTSSSESPSGSSSESPSASPSGVDPNATDNTITIYKWLCPYGYDYTDPASDPESDCTQAVDDITFPLDRTAPTTSTETSITGDDLPGVATFTGFEAGTYNLTEYGSPYGADGFRICNDFGFGNPGPEATVVGEPFTFEVEEGQTFDGFCDWFNIPTGGSVTVYKWLCPDDYDYTDPASVPVVDCYQVLDGIGFELAPTDGSTPSTVTTGDTGQTGIAEWENVDPGDYTLTEINSPYRPDGFFQCYFETSELIPIAYLPISVGEGYGFTMAPDGPYDLVCDWFNVPYGNSITVHKWNCPYGYDYEGGGIAPWTDCTEVANGIPFTVSSGTTSLTGASGDDGPGTVIFTGIDAGVWNVEETPPLYATTVLINCYEDEFTPTQSYSQGGPNPWATEVELTADSGHWTCDFYNILSDDPGDVVIYKWTCPEGYDLYAYGANPYVDCTEATNGVQFNASGPDGYASQTDTGDAIDGAVMFGGLEPGSYTFTETIPPNTWYIFVGDCTGTSVDAVHPFPLWQGNDLTILVAPGDRLTCNWFNVPYADGGTVVVTKYWCLSPTYTSDVDCQIYEQGMKFTLTGTDSGAPSPYTGTTGANGQYTWNDVEPGHYTISEQGYSPCRVTASRLDGGSISVEDGQTTYITVYNCARVTSGKPSPQPSVNPPGKFPNTGTDPNAAAPAGTGAPVMGEESPSASGTTRIQPVSPSADASAGESTESSASGCPSVTAPNVSAAPSPSDSGSGSPSASPSASAQEEVSEVSLAPSPEGDVEECARGEAPVSIAADAVDMDLDLEVLETVDGTMQAPTGAEFASWYRETSRLGEDGPIVIAGHLNYWNVPEGPFYALAQFQPGDIITLTGADGATYDYVVRSTAQHPSDASPDELFASVQDQLGGETLVLITCGGEWDASISEYNERTVVVATRVPPDEEDGA